MGLRHGRPRQGSQQAKRKNNTHPHILLSTMTVHSIINARLRPAPTSVAKSAVTKRKRMQRMWRRRDNALIAA